MVLGSAEIVSAWEILNAVSTVPVLLILLWIAKETYEIKIALHRDFATKAEVRDQATVAGAIHDLTNALREMGRSDRQYHSGRDVS